jgi:LPS-assembly lipoprotein
MSFQSQTIFRILSILALLQLTACGFQPLYASREKGSLPDALNQVFVASIPERSGQILRNHLIDRLYDRGTPEKPDYDLAIGLRAQEINLGVRLDATSARTRYDLDADYRLTRRSDGQTILSGTARSSVNYARFEAQYATLTAREDATERALREVGEQIVNRLALHFANVDTVTP